METRRSSLIKSICRSRFQRDVIKIGGLQARPTGMNITPTTEDRVWAVIAHLSALAFGMGIALPIVGWSDQRRKSNYAAFQSLQALGYQSLGFTVWALSYLVVVIVVSLIILAIAGSSSSTTETIDAALAPWLIVLVLVVFGFLGIYLVLPVIAAIACALGKDFRYPLLGGRLARYLGYEAVQEQGVWLNEEHEVRWVAAMGHFSILIVIWGMLAPLATWMLQGKHNLFLKFHSVQTLVYQALATILYFLGIFFYLVGVALIVAGLGAIEEVSFNSTVGVVGVVVFSVTVLLAILLLLFLPFMHILGQWAGYRVLKGDNYQYPFVGRFVDQWMSKYPAIEEN
jgi:uncharacterized Tic20 family protein